MSVFTAQGFARLIQSSPLIAVAVAAGMGLITSISPCTFLRGATLFGLVGEREDRRQGLWVAGWFVAGLTVAYVILGVLLTFVTGFNSAARFVYPLAGVMLLALGLNMAGLLKLPKHRGPKAVYELRSRLTERVSGGSSFLLGGTFAFMICPCCLPALLAIYTYTFATRQFAYGVLLVAVFTIAHSVPLLLIGYFGHLAKRLAGMRRFESAMNFLLGVLVFATGAVLLWIA